MVVMVATALQMATFPVTYRIPLKGIKFSTNKIYAGIHWAQRKSIKDSITGYAGVFCRPIAAIASYPVSIRYQFVFGSQPLDTLNTAAMAKMFEDAFRALGILEDDDPAHVAQSILEVTRINRSKAAKVHGASRAKGHAQDEDYLEITINEYATKE